MKLHVAKETDGNITLKIIYKAKKEEINYTKMIKALYELGKFDEIEYDRNVSDKDKSIIDAMIDEINKASCKKKAKV